MKFNCKTVYKKIQSTGMEVDVQDVETEVLEFYQTRNANIKAMVEFLEFNVMIAYDGAIYLCYSKTGEQDCFYAHTLLNKCFAKCLHKVIDDLIGDVE